MTEAPLELRFAQNLRRLAERDEPRRLLVAFSGGLDSTVLLHLLRFHPPFPVTLTAAHFDHRMRRESGDDAFWARALAEEWGIDIEIGVADGALKGEASARDARYGFLRDAAHRTGAEAILTAHHADDQAETVLFRIVRGTGLHGLSGIPARSRSGLLRPLLHFWREELLEYAERNDLRWRTDASNATLGPVRNRLRLRILPEIEREVSPHARRNLVALAELARESEAAWRAVVAAARKDVIRQEKGALVLARDRLRGYDRPIQSRLLRLALRHFGIVPSRAGTRVALAFITDAPSGRELQLRSGARIRLEFDDARIERATPPTGEDLPATIEAIPPGQTLSTATRIGGRSFRVEMAAGAERDESGESGAIWTARMSMPAHFPLIIRARRPGDRVRTPGGTKSLKKLMIERRVPLQERSRLPLLADALGEILWVGALGTFGMAGAPGETALDLAVYEADG